MRMNSLKHKDELALVKAHTIDVTNFENELEIFKSCCVPTPTCASPTTRRRM